MNKVRLKRGVGGRGKTKEGEVGAKSKMRTGDPSEERRMKLSQVESKRDMATPTRRVIDLAGT